MEPYLADGPVFAADLLSDGPLRFRARRSWQVTHHGQSLAVAPDGILVAVRSIGADHRVGVAEIRLDLGWGRKVEEATTRHADR